jgi:hypothetical protein
MERNLKTIRAAERVREAVELGKLKDKSTGAAVILPRRTIPDGPADVVQEFVSREGGSFSDAARYLYGD